MLAERINAAIDDYRAAFSTLSEARTAVEAEPTRARQEHAAAVALDLYTAKGYVQGWLAAFAFVCPERVATHRRLSELWAETLRHAGDPDASAVLHASKGGA